MPILPLLPRLPIRTLEQLLACREFVHEDRCQWVGDDSPRPCTCGIPRLIEALVAVHGDQLGLNPPARHDSKA